MYVIVGVPRLVEPQDAMDDDGLADLVAFLRKRLGRSGIIYCHKVGWVEM